VYYDEESKIWSRAVIGNVCPEFAELISLDTGERKKVFNIFYILFSIEKKTILNFKSGKL
jgi:hypothetical protein